MRHRSPYWLSVAGLPCLLIALLAACAAPTANPATPDPAISAQPAAPAPAAAAATPAQTPDQHAPRKKPPKSDPLPPRRLPAPIAEADTPATGDADTPVELDFSCSTDADCAVKNVGNCCGYYPQCVNKDSPTNPQAVQAQCAKSGRVGVCGFPSITSCQCVQGACEGSSALIPSS